MESISAYKATKHDTTCYKDASEGKAEKYYYVYVGNPWEYCPHIERIF